MRYALACIVVTTLMVACGERTIATTDTYPEVPPVTQTMRTPVLPSTVQPTEPAISVQEATRMPEATETTPPRPEQPQPRSDPPSTPTPSPTATPASVPVTSQVLERYAAGQTLYNEGRLQAAISEYDTALRFDPQFAAAYASRGETYYALKDFARALHDYTEAIRINPENATYYYARAVTLTALTRDSQAQTDIAQAVALGSDRAELEARIKRLKYERHQACCSRVPNSSNANTR